MAAFTVSDLGEDSSTATDRLGLFLTVFSGMVNNAFDTKQVTMDKQVIRSITHGKTASFPNMWKASGGYHTAGAELAGRVIEHSERTINIQKVLIADVFIAEIDELMNHYAVRAEYAHQLGEYLANMTDTNTFRALTIGGDTGTHNIDVSGDYDGQLITSAAMATSASELQTAVYDAARYLDEKDVPESDRYLAVKPVQYYKLLTGNEFVNRDIGGKGSTASGNVEEAAGLQILKTNNIPVSDDSNNAEVDLQLKANFAAINGALSTNVATVWHKSAAGLLKLGGGVKAESETSVRHQGTLLVAKVAQGQNFLRPEAIVVLADTI